MAICLEASGLGAKRLQLDMDCSLAPVPVLGQTCAMDLEGKLIGHRPYGTDPPKPFEGSQHGPYVVTVRAGRVLFMYRDRTTHPADGFTLKVVERMIEGNYWGMLPNART